MLLLLNVAASAQVGALRGRVLFKQADGATVPVDGATVDVFRVDLAGRYNTKTARNGQFVFAGLPYLGVYVVAASAPNAKPQAISNVKAGREIDYELVLEQGDGTRLTREEAQASISGSAKAETADQILSRKFRAGNDALHSRSYDEAIKLFDECLATALAQPVVTAVLLANKSVAFKSRGVERYNTATSTHDHAKKSALVKSALSDFREAAESATRAVETIKMQPIPVDEEDRATQQTNKMFALRERAEAMCLLVTKVDPAQASAGLAAFQEYIDAEDDPSRKSRAELDAARMLVEAKSTTNAIEQYRRILVTDQQNLEAIFGYGFALYQSGEKDKFEDAARYLKFFLEQSHETDPLRQVATETLEKLRALR